MSTVDWRFHNFEIGLATADSVYDKKQHFSHCTLKWSKISKHIYPSIITVKF